MSDDTHMDVILHFSIPFSCQHRSYPQAKSWERYVAALHVTDVNICASASYVYGTLFAHSGKLQAQKQKKKQPRNNPMGIASVKDTAAAMAEEAADAPEPTVEELRKTLQKQFPVLSKVTLK